MNARFALNAANARWGSLYDALYGTDMISEDGGAERAGPYNSARGDKVIAFSKNFLDESVGLSNGSYTDATGFKIKDGALEVRMSDQSTNTLEDLSQYIGYCGDADNPSRILLKNNKFHINIHIDHQDSIVKEEHAGINELGHESAVTTIA